MTATSATASVPIDEQAGLSTEVVLTWITLVLTVSATILFARDLCSAVGPLASLPRRLEVVLFLGIVGFLIYGNITYQLTRLGHLRRLRAHVPATREELEQIYQSEAPPLTFLVPSYKEEKRIVRQTLLSAALQEYPDRRVVLLIDDPYRFDDPEALAALLGMRELAAELDALLQEPAAFFMAARDGALRRCRRSGLRLSRECVALAALYRRAAEWLESFAAKEDISDHTDSFFVDTVLRTPARAHRERSELWRRLAAALPSDLQAEQLLREYRRLSALFRVKISSFERKRYANLSHEPNKAMNLNTYIALLGRSYGETRRGELTDLVEMPREQATLAVPDAVYLITLDADSVLLPSYALRLVHLMESPDNERIAVAQTPYSAMPHPASTVERIAGATTDIQYVIHQGFTQHHATFWVGANALLRRAALEDIAVVEQVRGQQVKRYIQDRTVIEDTESTVDLIDKGWSLYNYPQRLAYSATPPDFGSLAIQRARWANGGLIILPKLLRYLIAGPQLLRKLREGFFRFHYLTSIAGVNAGLALILLYPFPDAFQSVWLPFTAIPYYLLYARDLWCSGYRSPADLLRVYALNLLLLPVNLGGVLRSLHQALRGHRIPFRRTPKIAGRTRVAARYVLMPAGIGLFCLLAGASDAVLRHPASAIFAAFNGTLFIYAIGAFIGFRQAWDDVRAAWKARASGEPALQQQAP
jgi:cellulose synthase/poly-beta-1,6-N-acetylglucosamine synthase-like glycosyltransferase